jgi:small subunit ribosomal protein S20
MANTSSAKKAARSSVRKNTVNSARRSKIRTAVKAVEAAIKSGDAKKAADALQAAQPELHRGVTKGVLKKNTASRKLSRLSAGVKKLSPKK